MSRPTGGTASESKSVCCGGAEILIDELRDRIIADKVIVYRAPYWTDRHWGTQQIYCDAHVGKAHDRFKIYADGQIEVMNLRGSSGRYHRRGFSLNARSLSEIVDKINAYLESA